MSAYTRVLNDVMNYWIENNQKSLLKASDDVDHVYKLTAEIL